MVVCSSIIGDIVIDVLKHPSTAVEHHVQICTVMECSFRIMTSFLRVLQIAQETCLVEIQDIEAKKSWLAVTQQDMLGHLMTWLRSSLPFNITETWKSDKTKPQLKSQHELQVCITLRIHRSYLVRS